MDYCGQRPPNRAGAGRVLVVAGFSRQTPKPGEARKNSTREAEPTRFLWFSQGILIIFLIHSLISDEGKNSQNNLITKSI